METVYDWITLAIFAGLIVLFLQRSASENPGDSLFHYLIAGVGLAVVNYLGNEENHLVAVIALVGVLAFIQRTLKPLDKGAS